MADTNELKPCPFCGGEAYTRERTCDKDTTYNPNDRAYPVVRCSKCFTTVAGKDWTGVSTAIEVWNKRADSTQPADAALVETYENAIKAALDFIGTVAGGASWWDDVWAEHDAAIAALRARAVPAPEGMAVDAARYRFLRDDAGEDIDFMFGRTDGQLTHRSLKCGEGMDAAIDAAIAAAKVKP